MSPIEEDVLSALVNLGYQRPSVEKALAGAIKPGEAKSDKAGSFDALFREALSSLSK